MGSLVVQKVITALCDSGLSAGAAWPGKAFPAITGPVAAVHLKEVDSSTMTATVEVMVLGPGAQGGTVCEETALEAMRVLWGLGAVCRQTGCSYDRTGDVFSVSLTAAFSQVVPDEGDDGDQGETGQILSAFAVRVADVLQPHAVSFQATQETGAEMEYVAASPEAVASHSGTIRWSLTLKEEIPPGIREPESPEGEFSLTVEDGTDSWRYLGCRWQTVRRDYSVEGLTRVRTGFALSREEV